MPTDIDKRMREIREKRDEIRASHEKVDEPEFDPIDAVTQVRVDGAIVRDMNGETFLDSYVMHSATALRRRAVAAGNGHSAKPRRLGGVEHV